MSCYFSIESSIVDGGGDDGGDRGGNNDEDWQWLNNNPSLLLMLLISVAETMTTMTTREGSRGVGGGMFDDFLLHNVLMGVLPYLDGKSLANFLEAARRPNIECSISWSCSCRGPSLQGKEHGAKACVGVGGRQ